MILVDTSVWVDHLRRGESALAALLEDGQVLSHPWVTGELAMGHLGQRSTIIRLLRNLPPATVATDLEVLDLIDNHRLSGLGIGYVDAHLLAAVMLTGSTRLWTRDKRLAAVAAERGLAMGNEQTP